MRIEFKLLLKWAKVWCALLCFHKTGHQTNSQILEQKCEPCQFTQFNISIKHSHTHSLKEFVIGNR